MRNLKITCGCDTEPDILTVVLNGVVPVAQLVCVICQYSFISVGVQVKDA